MRYGKIGDYGSLKDYKEGTIYTGTFKDGSKHGLGELLFLNRGE